MSLKDVHDKLLIIKETASSNSKIDLLTEYLNDEDFKLVVQLIYNDSKHYKVNSLPPFKPPSGAFSAKPSNQELFNFLNKLAEQKGASNADKLELSRIASMDKKTYDVVNKIVNKDAKCGFSGKTINKAWKDLIFLMPYCRCSTFKNKIGNIDFESGAIGQEKADGMFANFIIEKNKGSLIRSRNGNIVHQMDHLHRFFDYFPAEYRNTVYMGELLIMINGKILPRKTGNGILNSCLQNAAPSDKAEHAIIKLWDAVPQKDFWKGSCDIPYKYRLGRVRTLIDAMANVEFMSMITSKKLHSLKEAKDFYKKLRSLGKEGAIIKNQNALWKNHTSPDQVKMKNVMDVELRIVSWKHGKIGTKFEKMVGSVQLESDDGKISVSVSGFTDEERLINWDERIGKVATLECESLISDKSRPGRYSLYLPQNLEMRPDKSATDTLKDVQSR